MCSVLLIIYATTTPKNSNPMTAAERIEELRREINRHNHNYYVLNAPEISDRDFDMLLKELEALEKEHPEFADPLSPTQRVGSDLVQGFESAEHIHPMLSLSKDRKSVV